MSGFTAKRFRAEAGAQEVSAATPPRRYHKCYLADLAPCECALLALGRTLSLLCLVPFGQRIAQHGISKHARHEGAGEDTDTDRRGVLPEGAPIAGQAVDFIHGTLGVRNFEWDRGQVSVCYPGYPKPMPSEPETAYRYRMCRDAAHVDGLLPEGPERRRHLREHHGFILGIPMVDVDDGAAPFVVWDGSHEIVRDAFRSLYEGTPPDRWGALDVTEAYHDVRRTIFETCERVEIAARPGEAYLTHRLALHGVAPWADGAGAGPDGRMVVYFRPEYGGAEDWLNAP